jgi:branched chain amino acid efflux pump
VSIRPDVFAAILLMGVASHACRMAGFFLMRYIVITPRVKAWLNALPIALMGAILGPVAASGGPPEWTGLAVSIGLMKATGNDFLSVLAAVAAVASVRALGL